MLAVNSYDLQLTYTTHVYTDTCLYCGSKVEMILQALEYESGDSQSLSF